MKPKYYTKTGQHSDDVINKVKTFINELQIVQEKYYAELMNDLNLKDDSLDGWLFDYIYNKDQNIDFMFTEYLEDRGKNYEDFVKKEADNTSEYLHNYTKYDPSKSYYNPTDCMYNPSVTLMSEPDLETAFASPFDKSEFKKNPLPTITVNQPNHLDSDAESVSLDSLDLFYVDYPVYPDIWGSYDPNPEDVICEEQTPVTPCGFVSDFDKRDNDFIEHLRWNKRNIWNRFSRKK